jgi:hypothetical protein
MITSVHLNAAHIFLRAITCFRCLVILAVVSTCTLGNADVLPDQTDLKAAYCFPVVRKFSEINIDENWPSEFRNRQIVIRDRNITDLRRLQMYLLPRTSQLEKTALLLAFKRAEEDLSQVDSDIKKCDRKNPVNDFLKCMDIQTETASAIRVRSCSDLSFLPF